MNPTAKVICWRCIFTIVAALIFIGSTFLSTPTAMAAEEATAPDATSAQDAYNIVLLIDKSGSMHRTDPKRLARDAASMFVDSFYAESLLKQADGPEQSSSEVAVISFSENTEIVVPFKTMSSRTEVENIKTGINSIVLEKANTGATDLGRAVRDGTELLKKNSDSSKKNIIVLFTDGFTEFPYNDAVNEARKLKDSARMMKEGLQAAQEMECEIFVVGLNYDNSIEEEGRREIREIANSTQIGSGLIHSEAAGNVQEGLVNYLITSTPSGVQHFYEELFAYLLHAVEPIPVTGLIENGWTYYNIPIETPGIFAVNVYITSAGEPINKIILRDPDGIPQDTSKLPRGEGYALLTILHPDLGIWRIGAEGEVFYNVTYVPISTAHLEMEVHAFGSHGSLTVQAFSDNSAADTRYYNNDAISFTAEVTSASDGNTFPVDLSFDEPLNAMTGTFTVPQPGIYTVKASMTSAHMNHNVSQQAEFTDDPVIQPLKIELKQDAETTVDFSEQLPDGWDTVLQVANVEYLPKDLIDVTADGTRITVRGLKEGEGSLTVYISTDFGQLWTVHGSVQIISNAEPLNPEPHIPVSSVLAALAVLVLIMLAAALIWKKTRHIPGKFTITCETGDGGFFNQCESGPSGTSFTLYKLLKCMDMDKDDTDEGPVLRAIEACGRELKQDNYRIHLVKNNQQSIYRLGSDRRSLSSLSEKVFTIGQTELQITVTFQPDKNDADAL